jgi:hypothetical protein
MMQPKVLVNCAALGKAAYELDAKLDIVSAVRSAVQQSSLSTTLNLDALYAAGYAEEEQPHIIAADIPHDAEGECSHGTIYVAFPGTHNAQDVLDDADFFARSDASAAAATGSGDLLEFAHRGFYRRAEMLPKDLLHSLLVGSKSNLVYTGHSLGESNVTQLCTAGNSCTYSACA